MTVRIVQDDPNNDGEPLVGEVGAILTDERTHPSGIEVKLKNGAVGRVIDVVADPDAQ